MQWNKYHLYYRAAGERYRRYTDRMFDQNLSIMARVKLFFMFVLLLTLLGVVVAISLLTFLIFGTLSFCMAIILLVWSWIHRLFHPDVPKPGKHIIIDVKPCVGGDTEPQS